MQVRSCLYFFNAPLDNIFNYNVVQWQINSRKNNGKSSPPWRDPCMALLFPHHYTTTLLLSYYLYRTAIHSQIICRCDQSLFLVRFLSWTLHMRNSLSGQCISCYVKKIELKRCIKLLPTVPLPVRKKTGLSINLSVFIRN